MANQTGGGEGGDIVERSEVSVAILYPTVLECSTRMQAPSTAHHWTVPQTSDQNTLLTPRAPLQLSAGCPAAP